ncbi:MAG: outer membrane beta-barrel protein [Vicinamibacterales bacterium]
MRIHVSLITGAALLGALVASPSMAQQPGAPHAGHATADLAGGYSFLRELPQDNGDPRDYQNGWFVSGARQLFTPHLMVVGEVGGNSRANLVKETQRLLGVLGGVRYRITRGARLVTFVQGLVGQERFSEPGFSQSGVAFQPGAGVDMRVAGPLGVRVQMDYRLAHEDDITFKELRIAAGGVVWFGR